MLPDRDYVYVFGPEWADELLNCIERDHLAQGTMAQYGLTSEDLRNYYLAQPHFDRIYRLLLEGGDDFVNDPVDTLLYAVKSAKDNARHAPSIFSGESTRQRQLFPVKRAKAVRILSPVALFVRLLTS